VRILHILTAFPRHEGDVIVPWLVELLLRLKQRGHEVEILTSAYRGGGNRSYAGIPVHRFRYFPAPWEDLTHDEAVTERMRRSLRYRIAAVSYVLCGILAAWRIGRRKRYDIIHVHWALPHFLFGKVAASGRLAKAARPSSRLVTTFYGAELSLAHSSSLPGLKRLLVWAARKSDRAVAISSHTARQVQRLAGVLPEVIPYGVGLPAAAIGGEREAVPGAPGGDFVALFVGRLVERKGVDVLLRAVARLPGSLPLRVVIVGDGPERGRLEALARELGLDTRVRFSGRVSAAELERSYRAARVFVLPAVVDRRGDTEGLGVVLLEAMSYGVPVVASRTGGITDIVEDGTNGILVEPGDPDALAAALERLARDPVLASRLGEAGRRTVEGRFSWDAIAERWEQLYRSLAGGKSRA
jgi:glycosyltransferase involved in cell wall biosynthesis